MIARTVIANLDDELVVCDARGHGHRRAARRVLRGVLEQMGERRRRQPRIQPHGEVGVDGDVHLVSLKRVLDLIARRRDDLGGMRPPRFGGHGAGVDARHLEEVLEQPRQSLDFRQYQVALLEAVLARAARTFRCCSPRSESP